MGVKEYFRVDTIELEMVNCPFGACLLSKCKKCPYFEGVDNNFINHSLVKCSYFKKLEEVNKK